MECGDKVCKDLIHSLEKGKSQLNGSSPKSLQCSASEAEKDDSTISVANSTMSLKEVVQHGKSGNKRRVHVIQSRYMQKLEQSILQKKHTPVLKTSGSYKVTKERAVTPKTSNKKTYLVSTPTEGTLLEPNFEGVNVSSIVPASKALVVPTVKKPLGPLLHKLDKNSQVKTSKEGINRTDVGRPKIKNLFQVKAVEHSEYELSDLDILYCKETLLAFKIKEEKDKIEKSIADNLLLLWSLSKENSALREEDAVLRKKLLHTGHELIVHKLLSEENAAMMDLLPKLSDVEKKSAVIANSLDKCQTHIPVKNLLLPKDKGDLVLRMEQLISELTYALQINEFSHDLPQMANTSKDVGFSLEAAKSAIKRSNELLSQLEHLSNKEVSILNQRIQETPSSLIPLLANKIP